MPPFDLQTAVNRVTWAWFWELPHRLNVALEIVDGRHASMLPVGSGSMATILRRMLASAPAPLKAAISNALESKQPYGAFLGGHQCVCVALAQAGVLVL